MCLIWARMEVRVMSMKNRPRTKEKKTYTYTTYKEFKYVKMLPVQVGCKHLAFGCIVTSQPQARRSNGLASFKTGPGHEPIAAYACCFPGLLTAPSAPRSRLRSKARSRDGCSVGRTRIILTCPPPTLIYRSRPRPWALKALPNVIKPCT
jgi:hypothetical protein